MVECQLPKLKVAGSIPVARSTILEAEYNHEKDRRSCGANSY